MVGIDEKSLSSFRHNNTSEKNVEINMHITEEQRKRLPFLPNLRLACFWSSPALQKSPLCKLQSKI